MELTKELFDDIADCLDEYWLDIKGMKDYEGEDYWGGDISQVKTIIATPNKDAYRMSKMDDIPNIEVEIDFFKTRIFIYKDNKFFTMRDFSGERSLLYKLEEVLDSLED